MAARYDFSITAKSVGNWRSGSRRIRHISRSMPGARSIIRQVAERSRDRIKSNILRQRYRSWAPLSPATLKRKSAEGTDMRKLIEHTSYVNAIKVVPMGPNQWGVGVLRTDVDPNNPERNLAQIGLFHEYGTKNMPARPHWRVEYQNFQRELNSAMTAYMRGRTQGKP